jgi:transcriptional regulator with XRE-family HTH domain
MTTPLGSRIRARRRELDQTQRNLAELLECTVATLCNIENGVTNRPSLRLLRGIAKHQKMSLTTVCALAEKGEVRS